MYQSHVQRLKFNVERQQKTKNLERQTWNIELQTFQPTFDDHLCVKGTMMYNSTASYIMKKIVTSIFILLLSTPLFSQEWNDPATTTDWDQVWKSGFYQSVNVPNAPEPTNWFWGINLNHSSNNANYRYNGQILIKNDNINPRMYFRSTDINGTGTWAKVVHSHGSHTIGGNLTLGSNLIAKKIYIDDPRDTQDWNTIWQSGFFQSYNAQNDPEPQSSQWFWGINMNHSSNRSDYKYNGQIAIKNSSTAPTMYFRSTNVNGDGTWAKILHDQGNQKVNGNLTVDGQFYSERVKVQVINGPDYVFEPDYDRKSIDEVKSYIEANKHLPNIPSAKEMAANGVELAEFNMKLLEKIEELTLYLIEQNEETKTLKAEVKSLKQKVKELEKE